jgi:hypothetical protein
MVLSPGGREAPTALQLSLQLQHVDGRCPGRAMVPASECPKNGLSDPLCEAARHERRRCARHGRGGGPGVVLEETEHHDDMPVKVDDADEDDQVDDIA